MGRHGRPDTNDSYNTGHDEPLQPLAPPTQDALIRAGIGGHLRALRLTLGGVNLVAAVALSIDKAGTSPAFTMMQQYLPLRVWAVGFALVVLLLAIALLGYPTQIFGHLIASVLWMIPAVGAVFGILYGTTGSPTASLTLTGLLLGVAAHHVLALVFLRRVTRLDR